MDASDQPDDSVGGVAATTFDDLVVVANRLPVQRVDDRWEPSPGGLVAALEPAVHAHRTQWVGWTGGTDDPGDSFEYDGIVLHPIGIDEDGKHNFYDGFSNGTLWPLYHDSILIPEFHQHWWDAYVEVNQRFAERVAEVAPPDSLVWVHDYQLALVPELVRQRRPDVRIGYFLHIPFPSQELFLRIPWRAEIVRGMLGAAVLGFQTAVGAENFRQVARRLLDVRREGSMLEIDGRWCRVSTFPVGIDARRIASIAADPATIAVAEQIRDDLGDPRRVVLGVDRLDYTKGIEVRVRAWRELLEDGDIDPADTVLVQIAQPSRDEAPGYREVRNVVEQMVGEINGKYGQLRNSAVKYIYQGQSLNDVVAFYLAADVMLVTPFRDGMNLVAKEYIAARRDYEGVLILSEFTGAAHQLNEAVLVNPFDVVGVKAAILGALQMSADEQRRRMHALSRSVRRFDARWWARQFLAALAP